MTATKPQHVMPLTPSEFGIAFQIAIDAGERHPAAASSPSTSPFELAAFALKRHFGDDDEKFESALLRFRALMALYTKGSQGNWVRGSERGSGATDIHPAVLDVASELRLARNGKFQSRKFLQAVAKVARERYADLTEWPLTDD